MTQVSLVPNPTQLKRHVCAGMCLALRQSPSTMYAGAWVLQVAASPHAPINSAVRSENTHSLEYLRYSVE